MVYAKVTNRDSLRDLIVAINAHSGKSYHLGFGKRVTLSNLAKANVNHNSKIFEEFAYFLNAIAQKIRANEDFQINWQAYASNYSNIDL